jgi:hypothetical protein
MLSNSSSSSLLCIVFVFSYLSCSLSIFVQILTMYTPCDLRYVKKKCKPCSPSVVEILKDVMHVSNGLPS